MSKVRILTCAHCRTYTLEAVCPSCHKTTSNPVPPKYSVEDKYGHYRREVKRPERMEKQLLRQ